MHLIIYISRGVSYSGIQRRVVWLTFTVLHSVTPKKADVFIAADERVSNPTIYIFWHVDPLLGNDSVNVPAETDSG
jgi:hypothetical protein